MPSSGPHEFAIAKSERGILDQIEANDSEMDLDILPPKFVWAAVTIQRQVRVMINRNRFRISLYKLILLKNIVETKVHKERMQMLFAFEQLIINTEEADHRSLCSSEGDERTKFIEQTGLTHDQIKEVLENESDPYLRQ